MASMGYRKGMGLGKRESGITSALGHRSVGSSRGVIVEISGKKQTQKSDTLSAAPKRDRAAKRPREAGAMVTFVAASGSQSAPAYQADAGTVAAFAACTDPRRIVWFRNLGLPDEASEDLVDDFVQGCEPHGAVEGARLRVESVHGSESSPGAGVGVEVLFADALGAASAASALSGRSFGQGVVVVDTS
jgi:hypothetical protein